MFHKINAQVVDTIGATTIHIDSLVGFTSDYTNSPWDLHWGPDNKLWYTMGNRICRYDTTTNVVDTLFKRFNVSGNYALSVATHPNFIDSPVVYITYDTMSTYYAGGNRIVLYKYQYSSTGDSLYNEVEVLSWYHGGEHSGGRLHVGSDNYLYVTTAEYWPDYDTLGNLSGRILRVNLDGSIPSINLSGQYWISYGHRNPQGIVQVSNGNIICSELGQIVDELNLVVEGKNYGWPAYDGFTCIGILPDSCTSPTFIHEDPIDTAIRPPSGIAYYNHNAIPELNGCILQSILSFGGYQGGMVASKLNTSMDDVVSDVHYFKGEFGRWRDVTVSPDGKIYAITHDRQIPEIVVLYNPDYHVGIEDYQKKTIKLFPNPAHDIINIESVEPIKNWQIISVDGKVLLSGECQTLTCQINAHHITKGFYYLQTTNGCSPFVKN